MCPRDLLRGVSVIASESPERFLETFGVGQLDVLFLYACHLDCPSPFLEAVQGALTIAISCIIIIGPSYTVHSSTANTPLGCVLKASWDLVSTTALHPAVPGYLCEELRIYFRKEPLGDLPETSGSEAGARDLPPTPCPVNPTCFHCQQDDHIHEADRTDPHSQGASASASSTSHAYDSSSESHDDTAFGSPWGQFRWKRMPMGLHSSPSTWQKCVNQTFSALLWRCVVAYVDDVLIYSRTWEEHLSHIELVLDMARDRNLLFSAKKA